MLGNFRTLAGKLNWKITLFYHDVSHNDKAVLFARLDSVELQRFFSPQEVSVFLWGFATGR